MSLAFHVAGDEGCPVIVFLHAIATSGAMWQPQFAALASDWRVIALDLPGHSASPRSATPTMASYAADVIATLDALGIGRAGLVGLSLGSMVAQQVAAQAPDRVTGLVLSNGIAFAPDPVREMWRARIATAQAEGMAGQVAPTLERWFTPAFRASHADTVAAIGQLVADTPLAGYVDAAQAIAQLDNRAALAAITAPTLVLAGQEDHAAPAAAVEAIAASIPGATFETIPGPHLMNVELAQIYSRRLAAFFSAQGSKA